MDQRLLRRFLEVYPFQPATALWRAAEIGDLGQVPIPPGLGLDLGCGDGRLTRVLAEERGGLRLVGLDVDPMETELARGLGFYERVHTVGAEQIPESNETFDFVLSISVMEHIPRLEAVLGEVARVLKRNGRLIATVPSAGFHASLRGPLLGGGTRAAYLQDLDRRVAHLRYWTVDEWRTALQNAGLRLVQAIPIMSPAEMRRWETLSRLTAGVLHVLARRKAPIEIQRSLGLRRAGQRMPSAAAAILGPLLAAGLRDLPRPSTEQASGCLIVVAERP